MLEKIYYNMPIWLQNFMISIYGLKIKNSRFGSHYKSKIQQINLDSSIESEKNNIKRFLIDASINVPYYAISLKDSIDINDELTRIIEKFPILTKDILRSKFEQLLASDCINDLISVSTSGSTGSPLEVKMDDKSREINYAFFHKFLEEIGVSEFERSATFAGRIMVHPEQKRQPYWRKNRAMDTLLLSSYHLSRQTCLDYIIALENWAPIYIDSYPSAIYELALLLREKDYKPKLSLKAIVTSSETLYDYQREVIESMFNCIVYDYYGCAEQSVLAFQTPSSNSHYIIPSQYCLVEVLNEDLSPVGIGETGKVICTNIFNKAAPIIRYDIGDNAIVSEYFPGSRFVKSLKRIEGRSDDVIVTTSGNKVGRLDPVFKGMKGIKETQIVQESLNQLVINIVTLKNTKIDEVKLRDMIRLRVGNDMEISINYVENIPRTKSGKFRSVISRV